MLCELLWPELESKKALMNLQTIVYSLRKTMGENSRIQVRLEYAANYYTIHRKDTMIDVEHFASLFQRASDLKDTFIGAVRLYTGDYLEKDGWLWAEPKKAALHKKYLSAVQRLRELEDRS